MLIELNRKSLALWACNFLLEGLAMASQICTQVMLISVELNRKLLALLWACRFLSEGLSYIFIFECSKTIFYYYF